MNPRLGLAKCGCILATLAPGLVQAAAPRQSPTHQALLDAEQASTGRQAASKAAANRAAQASAETLRLAHERVMAAARLQQAEVATAEVAARIELLTKQRRDAEQKVQLTARAMQPLLPVIERLSVYPAETLLAVPASPDQVLRGILVLQGLSRQMEQQAEALRRDQADLDTAAEALRREEPRLLDARAAQKHEADTLDQSIATAHAEQAAAEANAKQAATQAEVAASRMETLRTALLALETQRRTDEAKARQAASRAERQKHVTEAEAARVREAVAAHPVGSGALGPGAAPNGQLQPPVIGVAVKRWGEQTDSGPATGVSYYAPPAARVISPCGGRVVFAENFRSYGLLLIVDCGGGYHVVLSGFDRLDVKLGQNLVGGEPVGVMPPWEPGSSASRPALYIELRHDGAAVDPTPWLRPNRYPKSH